MHRRNLLYVEPFTGLDGLIKKLQDVAHYARIAGNGSPAIESRALRVDRTLTPHIAVYEETLSDRSTQLVAVVLA